MFLLLYVCFFFVVVMRENLCYFSMTNLRLTLFLNSTSRYLYDLLNVNNVYFDHLVDRIYPTALQLNEAKSFDVKAPFLDLDSSISKLYWNWNFTVTWSVNSVKWLGSDFAERIKKKSFIVTREYDLTWILYNKLQT